MGIVLWSAQWQESFRTWNLFSLPFTWHNGLMDDARRATDEEFERSWNSSCRISMISWVGVDNDGVSPGKICKEYIATQVLGRYLKTNKQQIKHLRTLWIKPRMKEDIRGAPGRAPG